MKQNKISKRANIIKIADLTLKINLTMPNGSNLPQLIKYGNKIKEVTIREISDFGKSDFSGSVYFIKFVEIQEKVVEKPKLIFFKKQVTVPNEVTRIVPFSFKTFEAAKDFAQYLPGMKISGERLYAPFEGRKCRILYETYEIRIEAVEDPIFIKFTPMSEHPNFIKRNREDPISEYYINDIDKKYQNGNQGNWYAYDELVVDHFFTHIMFKYKEDETVTNRMDPSSVITDKQYETLSNIKEHENNTVHKYILMEEPNEK